MSRPDPRTLLRWGAAAAVAAGVGHVAHAASLNGLDGGSLDAYVYPAAVPLDETPPTIVATVAPEPNSFGWNNSAVTVSFVCDDTESGVASCTDPTTLSSEGGGQVVNGTAIDHAGNAAAASVAVNVDLTSPTVEMQGILPGVSLSLLPPATCTASDALSGVEGPCVVTFEHAGGIFADAVGTARDRAGNQTEERVRFSLTCLLAATGVDPFENCR